MNPVSDFNHGFLQIVCKVLGKVAKERGPTSGRSALRLSSRLDLHVVADIIARLGAVRSRCGSRVVEPILLEPTGC